MKCLMLAVIVLTGCTVGPNYKRPSVAMPQNFRAPDPLPPPQASSLADLKWWEVFKDEKLQDLIRAALAANYDIDATAAQSDDVARWKQPGLPGLLGKHVRIVVE